MSGKHREQKVIEGDLANPQVREAINRAARARGIAVKEPLLPVRRRRQQ